MKVLNSTNSTNNQTATESNFDIFSYLNLDEETKTSLFGNMIDHKLDIMVKDWFSSHDILFSIHPTDGSILIWLVDWLDEYLPGNFRQAQVSFHAKLPNSIPVGDAMSLTNSVFLYTEPIKIDEDEINKDDNNNNSTLSNRSESNDDLNNTSSSNNNYLFIPGVVYMVSKHNNGTLNLWRLQFQENSKYQSLVNVSHIFRTCGHRFRVSDITSHPILPFLLTNSINDLHPNELHNNGNDRGKELLETFQKGLIIWGVEPVGPLSKSGGIYELARVDSSKENAFENIAWFPCFLPSTTLGNLSSSPSTLFASTDSTCITIYQAVFDARTLLHDLQNQDCTKSAKSTTSNSNTTDIPFDCFNVVSIQSTARPGCIIDLEKLADSNGNWIKADLFHVYQECLVTKPNLANNKLQSTKINQFNETYFLVLLEKRRNQLNQKMIETIHMWKITITSAPVLFADEKDPNKIQDESYHPNMNEQKNRLTITSARVCEQNLNLPDDVYVICADSAAADLSSSAMFTLNKVPYLFATACSDGIIRFWSCRPIEDTDNYEFYEWELNSTLNEDTSKIKLDTFPLAISCSYNSRFAVAFQKNNENHHEKNDLKFVNFWVHVYECESTGGSEWRLEDCINLEDVTLPDLESDINFDYIFGNQAPIRPARSCHSFKNIVLSSSNSNNSNSAILPNNTSSNNLVDAAQIPSTAAKISVKRQYSISKNANQLTNPTKSIDYYGMSKKLIKLDWASTENGSHILTIGLGNQIFVYSCVTKEIADQIDKSISETNKLIKSERKNSIMSLLPNTLSKLMSSNSLQPIINNKNNNDFRDSLVRWIQFRSFELDSADDMQALPTQIKWVRDGLLIVGLNTEMQVYSQWSSLTTNKQKQSSYLSLKTNDLKSMIDKKENKTIKPKTSLVVPKNHSVLDLKKLNKLTNMKQSNSMNGNLSQEDIVKRKSTSVTAVFDDNQILELIHDSGIFMQAK